MGSYVDAQQYGQVVVTNGGKVNMQSVEWLNGHGSPARLTIVDGGEVTLNKLRISQSQASEVHLNEGGLLKAVSLVIDPGIDPGPKGTFWFNGGRLQSRDGRANFFDSTSTTPISSFVRTCLKKICHSTNVCYFYEFVTILIEVAYRT